MNQSRDSEAGFTLDPRLAADCLTITDLQLSRVLLMNDRRYPWIILVPRRANIREIHHLPLEDQTTLLREITKASKILEDDFAPDKLNVGALGNIVSQLHIHIIARNDGDFAWPGPVWGNGTPTPYSETAAQALLQNFKLKFTQ